MIVLHHFKYILRFVDYHKKKIKWKHQNMIIIAMSAQTAGGPKKGVR